MTFLTIAYEVVLGGTPHLTPNADGTFGGVLGTDSGDSGLLEFGAPLGTGDLTNPVIGSGAQTPGNMLALEFYQLLETSAAVLTAALLIFALVYGLRKIKSMTYASS